MYSTNPAGVATVRFKMIEDAEKCISVMQGRWFGGRQVKAHMWGECLASDGHKLAIVDSYMNCKCALVCMRGRTRAFCLS